MKKIKELFTGRSIYFYIELCLSAVMLISSILYIAIDPGALKIKNYSRILTFVCVLIGSMISWIMLFKNKYVSLIIPLVSAILYSVAVGRQFYLTAYPFSDLMTGVNWFGGNLAIYLTFFIIFLAGAIIQVVLCFFKEKEKVVAIKANK